MNAHYVSTSRSNPLFYIFSQLYDQTASINSEQQWEQCKEAAWLEFWQREGHEQLEQKWHKLHPDYTQEIDVATSEQQENWETLWQEHVSQLSAHFWHIFTCAFQNYENDLTNGLRKLDEVVDVNEDFADLNITQEIDSAESSESNDDGESYLTANDDPDVCDEEQQLRLLGLPTSFGTQLAQKKRKARPQLVSESDSDCDLNQFIMPKDEVLHTVQSGSIKKKKKRQKKTKIPESLRNNNAMLKYWFKRFSLFSLFDRGIRLDDESWFSVTPEKIAKQIALRLSCDIVVDAFCGCGGNAIQFAKTCRRVIAVDIDANKLAMAKHNAAIYGVADKIEFIHADFLQFASSTRLRADVVFLSPPWGGPNYQKSVFNIEEHLLPVGATQLMQYARRLSNNIGIYLPRSSSINQVVALSKVGQQCEVEHSYLDTRLVAITAYFGDVIKTQQQPQQDDEDQ
ncbi:hypothetical protein KR093_001730 [Drosophila rubida]|uniref:Trimethylguanosine synthase n=1 Tax=Drosophila rubida TaxID=30044 RepID=A0AAD4PGI4_9MUSC|nr:hypothetical protein KR093_001730 [Drosophila rubida]